MQQRQQDPKCHIAEVKWNKETMQQRLQDPQGNRLSKAK